MPKNSTPFPRDLEPFHFEMVLLPDGEGGLEVHYASDDDRAHAVCRELIGALADGLDLACTAVD